MALEDIIKSILDEARQKADEIKKQGDQQVQALKKESDERLKLEKEKVLKEAKLESEKQIEQGRFLASSQMKRNLLDKKQEIIDRVYAETLKKLTQLKEEEEIKLLIKLIKQLPELSTAKIVPVRQKAKIIDKALEKSGRHYKLAETECPGQGGFIFSTGKLEIDNRYQTLIANLKEETEMEVAKILFT